MSIWMTNAHMCKSDVFNISLLKSKKVQGDKDMVKITEPSKCWLSDRLFVSREDVDPPVENGSNPGHQHQHQQVVQAAPAGQALLGSRCRRLSPEIWRSKSKQSQKLKISMLCSPWRGKKGNWRVTRLKILEGFGSFSCNHRDWSYKNEQ